MRADSSIEPTHVIVLPGGGYVTYGSLESEPIVEWLAGLGIAASVFRYPTNVRHPEPQQAIRAEIDRVRPGGAGRVGLIGFSAGGHAAALAALAGGMHPEERVDFVVLGYPVVSMWRVGEASVTTETLIGPVRRTRFGTRRRPICLSGRCPAVLCLAHGSR